LLGGNFKTLIRSESEAEAVVLVLGSVVVRGVVLVSDTAGDLSEAGFDSLSDGAEELELVLSGLGGRGVLLVDGSAERIRVVEESLVAVALGGGGVNDAGLGDDALLEGVELVLQTFLLGDQVLNGALESALVGVVVGDGRVFSGGGFLEVVDDSVSEVVEHALDSLEETFVGLDLGVGHLGEGAHNGGHHVSLSDLDGGLQHAVGVLGELGEVGFTTPDLLQDDEGLIDGLGEVLVNLGGGLEDGGLTASGVLDEGEVGSVVLELLLGDGPVAVGSDVLGVASVEGLLGFLEGGGGVGDFSVSETGLVSAFLDLGVVESVVVGLFLGDGGLELVQLLGDGVQGSAGLELGLDLGQEGHDGPLGGEVKGVLLEHGAHRGVGADDEDDKEDGGNLHL